MACWFNVFYLNFSNYYNTRIPFLAGKDPHLSMYPLVYWLYGALWIWKDQEGVILGGFNALSAGSCIAFFLKWFFDKLEARHLLHMYLCMNGIIYTILFLGWLTSQWYAKADSLPGYIWNASMLLILWNIIYTHVAPCIDHLRGWAGVELSAWIRSLPSPWKKIALSIVSVFRPEFDNVRIREDAFCGFSSGLVLSGIIDV